MIPLDQVGASLPSGKVTRNSRSGGIPGNPVTQKFPAGISGNFENSILFN